HSRGGRVQLFHAPHPVGERKHRGARQRASRAPQRRGAAGKPRSAGGRLMAGSSSQTGASGMINGINVTPLVDIMLVLLIIFMVTAKLVVAPTTALGVQLPKAASGDTVQVVFSV